MKVFIGQYRDWIGPFQIAEKILFWKDKNDDTVYKFGSWLSGEEGDSPLAKLCNWFHSKKQRKIDIHIDRYDVWNLHNTASLILLPMFLKLKESKQGSGYVDDEDVPDYLKSVNSPELTEEEKNNGHTDINFHIRYEWVLNEIIWALEQDNNDWEEQYWKVHPEIDLKKYPEDEGKTVIPVRWKQEGECDWEARAAHQKRIDNGFRLMGKYWQSFWT